MYLWQALFACEGTSEIAQVNIPGAVYCGKLMGHRPLIRLSNRGMKMESSMSKVDKEGQILSPFPFGLRFRAAVIIELGSTKHHCY